MVVYECCGRESIKWKDKKDGSPRSALKIYYLAPLSPGEGNEGYLADSVFIFSDRITEFSFVPHKGDHFIPYYDKFGHISDIEKVEK